MQDANIHSTSKLACKLTRNDSTLWRAVFMEMTFRWFGKAFDTVTLEQIRQIPGVTGIITTLYDTMPGEVWSRERIRALKDEVEAAGLNLSGIESVNVHDSISSRFNQDRK